MKPTNGKPRHWVRRAIAGSALLLVLAGIGWSAWMMGLLMYAFSLDAAHPGDIPRWLEQYMLIVWPTIITFAVVLPVIAFWCNDRRWFRVLLILSGVVAVTYMVGFASSLIVQAQ